MAKTVSIIMHDTLWALGVAQLIRDNFGLHTVLLRSVDQLDNTLAETTLLFIVSEQTFIANFQFFLTKKDRTVVIAKHSGETADANPSPAVIAADSKESTIVKALTTFCEGDATAKNASKLTDRETSVLKLVASGYINKEIADKLNISINTVLSHRKNITAKLGIKSVSGLSVYAIMNGIIDASAEGHQH